MAGSFRERLEQKAQSVVRRLTGRRKVEPSSTLNRPAPGKKSAQGAGSGRGRGRGRGGGRRRPLTEEELRAGKHHKWVGGDWERKGRIQIEFMKQRGLRPEHRLLDVGCGALRGGLHFVDYLQPGNYYGIEAETERIRAGRWELEQASLENKAPQLLVNDAFEVGRFGTTFEYALAVSLFTHLDMNKITRCLHEVGRVLADEGEFYATFIEAPDPAHLEPLLIGEGGGGSRFTNYDSNPFHHHFSELEWLAGNVGLEGRYVGDWGHPGNQKMILITRPDRDG